MTPSVGRVVHYVSHGTPNGEYVRECRAAIITQVVDAQVKDVIGLCVLNPEGQFFNRAVPLDDGRKPDGPLPTDLCEGLDFRGGTWHWPERVS